MRSILAILIVTCACGPSASTARGVEGTPLPAHARLDGGDPATEIHCPDGYTYSIVESRTRSIASGGVLAPAPVTDTAGLCARIRRN